jgi:hypothetical protein
MTGKMRGFIAKVWEVNPEIRFKHSLIHCKANAAKTLPGVLKNVLDEVIKIVSSNHGLSIHGFSGFMPGTYF